ncbi:aminopeptidase P family protein [Helicobacter aurati]|uniref:Aminopeptidase P family protein n=1 Tax=Helicobacter aurati TaxID=137778 RepID=A0A3D8J4Y8_9HELI|nr:aminopeptidase P family protein [Helicobacter aurati]RDU72290.1 aminopeptidase P family protein [Helicobacter aurati]
MNNYAQRIKALRLLMAKYKIDVYIVLTSDPHLSEYLPEYWESRKWLSGFNGSAGSLIITQDYAALWTDGRYWIQAQQELKNSTIELQKQDSSNTFIKWLEKNLTEKQTLATDFRVLPLAMQTKLQTTLQHKNITFTHYDLLTTLWKDRPALPCAPIYEHIYSPRNRQETLLQIRKKMQQHQANYHIITTLDDIAWLCNLRGNDISYNPVFLCFFLLSLENATLFVQPEKVASEIVNKLQKDGINIEPYEAIEKALQCLTNERILIDSSKVNAYFGNILQKNNQIIDDINPSQLLKACKNPIEIEHIREAMQHDGIALCNFFSWLEEALTNQQRISELDIAQQLSYFRAKSPLYISDSFATIAGFNANGAQPHYNATPQCFSYLESQGLLLIDSGGQYTKGTTDITRVVPIGIPSDEQKRDYTLVLKAHIALASASFPLNLPMPFLDSVARIALWKNQINYFHGTGHGVGYFLNVHEGPQAISCSANPLPKTQAKIGMVSSIEPGIYRNGKWGIRLENLVVNTKVTEPKENEFGEFLCFEVLTLCPFEISCLNTALLNEEEKTWLNNYHDKVKQALQNKLDGKAREWLLQRTQPI